MLTGLTSGLGGKLADQWAALLATPAFAFWAGGVAAVIYGNGGTRALRHLDSWLTARDPVLVAALLVLALLVVTASGFMAQRLTLPVLRLLEGYNPLLPPPLRAALVSRHRGSMEGKAAQWGELAARFDDLDTADYLRYQRLDGQLRRYPADPRNVMPSKLGNILRASETRITDQYGLQLNACWAALWLLLPAGSQGEVNGARASLDSSAVLFAWSALFLAWTPFTWWAVLVAVLGMALGSYLAHAAAAVYGDLIEGTFAAHRHLLYEALRWPLPSDPAAELTSGKLLSAYLWRGSDATEPEFTSPAG
jgi:hypothetical protein